MSGSLKDLNLVRKKEYVKDTQEEDFFLEMNKLLQAKEQAQYRDVEIEHPFIFIFGLPRSGTTLISQVLAHSFDVGYINNLIARFWLAPVHGIRISKGVIGDRKSASFQSDYARTTDLADIHEFGYFWRDLLKKETFADVTDVEEREREINWQQVKTTLANMQHAFGKPMVFKNIFGSYHLQKMKAVLGKVIYVYIERDPLDVAISILNARKKYYNDLNTWWSYTPPEYDQLKDLNYWEQIAGQIYFLRRYYQQAMISQTNDITVSVAYRDLCEQPGTALQRIQSLCRREYDYDLAIENAPPDRFPFRTYENNDAQKQTFADLIHQFQENNG